MTLVLLIDLKGSTFRTNETSFGISYRRITSLDLYRIQKKTL